jgi:hypothetical protein
MAAPALPTPVLPGRPARQETHANVPSVAVVRLGSLASSWADAGVDPTADVVHAAVDACVGTLAADVPGGCVGVCGSG